MICLYANDEIRPLIQMVPDVMAKEHIIARARSVRDAPRAPFKPDQFLLDRLADL